MNDLHLAFLSAGDLVRGYRRRDFSVVEVIANAIERADEVNGTLNCFTDIYAGEALEAARQCDRALSAGRQVGPLHGVPVAIKDMTPICGKRTTLGSKVFSDNITTADAVVVERLRQAGAIILGHTTTAEFAYAEFTSTPSGHHAQSLADNAHELSIVLDEAFAGFRRPKTTSSSISPAIRPTSSDAHEFLCRFDPMLHSIMGLIWRVVAALCAVNALALAVFVIIANDAVRLHPFRPGARAPRCAGRGNQGAVPVGGRSGVAGVDAAKHKRGA